MLVNPQMRLGRGTYFVKNKKLYYVLDTLPADSEHVIVEDCSTQDARVMKMQEISAARIIEPERG